MLKSLRQPVPSSFCLKCDVCCRYPEKTTTYAPYFFPGEAKSAVAAGGEFPTVGNAIDTKPFPMPLGHCYICRFFSPEDNACRIYDSRPFDCRLYPFMVTYDKDFKSVILALDTKCPYMRGRHDSRETQEYIDCLARILESHGMVEEINSNKNFINEFQEDSIGLIKLKNLSERICFSSLGLKRISPKDKELFDARFSRVKTLTSPFSFVSTYIWSGVLNILWADIHDALCVFAGNNKDYFLLLPPIDSAFNEGAVETSFEMLSRMNIRDFEPKIENLPEEFLEGARSCGLKPKISSREYVYNRKDLAELKGNKFKTKRNLANNFEKNYGYNYRKLEEKDISPCLELYKEWANDRLKDIRDEYFGVMAEDSYFARKTALSRLKFMNLEGRVIEIEGNNIRGYTAGYRLNKDVFVILFETADLNMKGLSQFIFREFSRDLDNYKYINTLGDSGIKNLKKAKDSYHPLTTPPLFTAFPGCGAINSRDYVSQGPHPKRLRKIF